MFGFAKSVGKALGLQSDSYISYSRSGDTSFTDMFIIFVYHSPLLVREDFCGLGL